MGLSHTHSVEGRHNKLKEILDLVEKT